MSRNNLQYLDDENLYQPEDVGYPNSRITGPYFQEAGDDDNLQNLLQDNDDVFDFDDNFLLAAVEGSDPDNNPLKNENVSMN